MCSGLDGDEIAKSLRRLDNDNQPCPSLWVEAHSVDTEARETACFCFLPVQRGHAPFCEEHAVCSEVVQLADRLDLEVPKEDSYINHHDCVAASSCSGGLTGVRILALAMKLTGVWRWW